MKSATPPETGGTIGKYQIVDRIGVGGFGTVFRGWDPVIKRPVAIKVCDARPEIRGRFLREAELAGGLHHPNITTVYDCGMEGETPYLVQEYLEGEDLSQLIARRADLDLGARIKVLVGIAVGLEHAHRAGVVHRDVKPANIRVLENRVVKIMDFGIAKALDSASSLTGSGVTVGSSSYMAPEQIRGDAIDARADVFSFGVLAFELLSFEKPFAHANLFRLLEMIVKDRPDPSLARRAPELPRALVEVVDRAMNKDPQDRFASMREVRQALVAAHPESAGAADAGSVATAEAENTDGRIDVLRRYDILDTPSEAAFDDLALLAARLSGTAGARISFVAADRVWIKASVGALALRDAAEQEFASTTLRHGSVTVIVDAAADPRFRDLPSVAGGLRFYAGVPLLAPGGQPIGVLSVHDRESRDLSADQRESLAIVASQIVAQLELRRRRSREVERSGEKLLLEVTGLSDEHAAAKDEAKRG